MKVPNVKRGSKIIGSVLIVLGIVALSKVVGQGNDQDVLAQGVSAQSFSFQIGFPQSVSLYGIEASSPVVGDVDQDGDYEIFVGDTMGKVYGWDHQGNTLSGFPIDTSDSEIVAPLILADLDGDKDLEIIVGTSSYGATGTAQNRARVFAWHHDGTPVTGWPQSMPWNSQWAADWSWNEVTSVAVADIDGDGQYEVLATTTADTTGYEGAPPIPAAYNAYAWEFGGTLMSGWPTSDTHDSRVAIHGRLATGDFNGDGKANPIVPRDYNILYAYDWQGGDLSGWPIIVFYDPGGTWGTSDAIEFGTSAPVLADLDQDSTTELINLGILADATSGDFVNSALMVFEPDGSRRSGWEYPALGSGWTSDQACTPYGVVSVANLDGDPGLEIIASTNDGYIRAYNHNSITPTWAFNYTQGQNVISGETVVGDIDGDGQVEIVFGTYHPDLGYTTAAKVWALEGNGTVVSGFPLSVEGDIGLCSAPALVDLDNDDDVELVAGVKAATNQLIVWDLPGTFNPLQMPWPQGRHDARRTAAYVNPAPDLTRSKHWVTPGWANYKETTRFYLAIRNGGGTAITDTITATIQIPSQLTDVQNIDLTPNVGTVVTGTNTLIWSGILDSQQRVTIDYDVRVDTTDVLTLTSQATIEHAALGILTRETVLSVNLKYFLPLIFKNSTGGH